MKQIIQNYKSGQIRFTEVPAPLSRHGSVLIRNDANLINTGTEKLMLDLAKKVIWAKRL